jgi:hypothetical protein
MQPLQCLSKGTRLISSTAILLLVYGYLCRSMGLYFFWESKSAGWILLIIGILFFLIDRIKIKSAAKKKALGEKIGIGICSFILLILAIFLSVIPFTDAYGVARGYLRANNDIRAEIGNVTGFGLIPTGGIEERTDSNGESGNATINLTVKGDRKYKDITIYLSKSSGSPEWKVEAFE